MNKNVARRLFLRKLLDDLPENVRKYPCADPAATKFSSPVAVVAEFDRRRQKHARRKSSLMKMKFTG